MHDGVFIASEFCIGIICGENKRGLSIMKDLYRKYYLEPEKINHLLQNGIIIFDTSALLDLYYYSEITRNEIFEKVFGYLKNRLWIPAQVYYEFLKNRDVVSGKPINKYKNLLVKNKENKDSGYVESILELSEKIEKDILKDLKGKFNTLQETTQKKDKHPYFSVEVYREFKDKLSEFEVYVKNFRDAAEAFRISYGDCVGERIAEMESNTKDNVFDAIKNRFQIGVEYDYYKMMEIAKEGAFRYEELIPPGYKDAKEKIGLQKYGDLYAWYQILEYAKNSTKDAIFVINDVKEDWFESDKKTPRFELLKEFNSKTQKSIWIMPMTEFLYQINHLLDSELQKTTIDDVERIGERKDIKPEHFVRTMDDKISMIIWVDALLMETVRTKAEKILGDKIDTNNPRLSYLDALNTLIDAKCIDKKQYDDIMRVRSIRNMVAHRMVEIEDRVIGRAIRMARKYIAYLNNWDTGKDL